jgi:ectoine hydroxylase-related dioxygenase (phytanoyl-CoA dioxygenase family)
MVNREKKMIVTQEQIQQYHDQGYIILEGVLSEAQLEGLRSEAQRYIDMMHEEMDKQGTDTLGISHRDKRYFVSLKHQESELISDFLFSPLMEEIARSVLGDDVYLFYEQYVIKAAEKGMHFGWHQDSGYVGEGHKPYLTCWITLDDMTVENGTVYILPYDRAGTREYVDHKQEKETNDKIGYDGDDPGIPVIVPAGSIACFSSTTFHRSGTNTTPNMRRVYLAQYSAEPITKTDSDELFGLAIPFIKNAERV